MRLRPLSIDDLDLLVLHRRRMWVDMGYKKRKDLDAADAVYRKWLRAQMKVKRLDGFAALDKSGSVIASGCLWLYEVHPRPGRPGPFEPYLMSMYTDPAHRGRGHAKRIVKELFRWCRGRGYGAAFLHASDAGRALYTKLGFTPTREMRARLAPRRARRVSISQAVRRSGEKKRPRN